MALQPSSALQASPFKFLDHFTGSEEDRRRFGGRDREVYDIVARVTNERTLVLFGPSGIGKTSLLLAGVFPALEERGVRPVYVRTLVAPLPDLCRALGGDCAASEGLREAVARASAGGPVVVVLDQIEELFLRFALPDREAFAEALAAVVGDPSLRLTVVFSLRVDFLGRLDELSPFLPDLLTHRYALQPLTPFGVRQAVTRPLVDACIAFEPAVVSRLITELEGVGFEPVLLQILCTELYKRAAARAEGGPVRLTERDVQGLGGRRGVFLSYLNEVSEALPADQQLLARLVLDALVTAEGTKRAVRLQDLPAAGFYATDQEAEAIAGLLVNQRILRRDERVDGEVWYELIHDQLIPALREWLEGDVEFSRFRQARAFVRNNAASGVWKEKPDAFGSLESLLSAHRERFRFTDRELELVVSNAIYHRSGQLPFWADRYGGDQSRALLLKMLGSGRDPERLAAAESTCFLTDEGGSLARACLRAALHDPDPAVREQAGRSLAKLGRDEEMRELRQVQRDSDLIRNDPALKTRVWEVYTLLYAEGRSLECLPWWESLWVRHRHARAVRAQAFRPALSRAWTGAVTGALAGALWCLAHFGLAEVVRWVREPETYLWRLSPTSVLLFGTLGAVLGWVLGGLVAFAAAWEAALRGEGRWFAAVTWRRPWALLAWLAVGLASYAGAVFLDKAVPPGGWRALAPDGCAVALACLLPLLVARGFRACAWPGVSRSGVWLAGSVAASGWPLLLLLVAVRVAREFQPGLLAGQVVLCGILVSGMSLIAILSLARSSAAHPLGPVPAVHKGLRRGLTVLALIGVAGVPPVFIKNYGTYRYLPRFAKLDPERGTFLPWEEKELNPADPPVFEVRMPEGYARKGAPFRFRLAPVSEGARCPGSRPEAAGPLRRRFLKPSIPSGAERSGVVGWCLVVESQNRNIQGE